VKLGYFKEFATLCDKEVKVMLTCVGTIQGVYCREELYRASTVERNYTGHLL
jgi:hypothetical protein